MLQNWNTFLLYNAFVQLQDGARDHPHEHRDFMASQGIEMKQGIGMATLVLEYLSQAIHLTKPQLRNVLQKTQSMHALASVFGPGILALLPLGAANR